MPSFSSMRDTTTLRHRYVKKVVIYVESESDANLFRTIVGPGYDEFLDFQIPPEKGTGCGPAKACVEKYRPGNPRIYALLDGEAVMPEAGGFDGLVKATTTIFSLAGDTGLMFLADHEAENILIRQSKIVDYIVDQETLANLGRKKSEDVEQRVDQIVERQFAGALCKYTSYRLHSDGRMTGVLAATHYLDRSEEETLTLLKERVQNKQCDWQTFNQELAIVQQAIDDHLQTLAPSDRADAKRRLADGKMAMKIMQAIYEISETWQVPLARQVALTDYATRFRQELFLLTDIHAAA